MNKKIELAKAILKRDKEDDNHSTDDICDLARELSELLLAEHGTLKQIKINYRECSGARGTIYRQTIKVDEQTYRSLQDKIKTEIEKDYPTRDKYIFNSHDIIYLKNLFCDYTFLNLTTLRFIALFLKDKRLKTDRNTVIEVL